MKPKKKIYLLVLILLIQLLLPTITHAQVSTTNTFTGIILQNQNLIAGTYQVSTNQTSLVTHLTWQNGMLTTQLYDPQGNLIDLNQQNVVTIASTNTTQTILIINPTPGEWLFRILGTYVPTQQGIPFALTISNALSDFAIPSTSPQITSQTNFNSTDSAAIVYIPEGQFTMGLSKEKYEQLIEICGENCHEYLYSPSKPDHKVYLQDYWIYQYEVTNQQYRQCVDAQVCDLPRKQSSYQHSDYFTNPTYNNYPVIFVDWYNAYQYCNWAGGALPTEAQWEKAARGSLDDRLYPWGDQEPTPSLANFGGYIKETTPVGAYPSGVSPYGLYDMSGNVYEWVNDWYSATYYANSPYNDPQGPSTSASTTKKVVRGGNYTWSASAASIAFHDSWEPDKSSTDVGFRCVLNDFPAPTTTTPTTTYTYPSSTSSNFKACTIDCDYVIPQTIFAEKIKKIYLEWDYANIPANAQYDRIWTKDGQEWAHYSCTWDGLSTGTEKITLTEPNGLASGLWTVEVYLNNTLSLKESIYIQGTWDYWEPAGYFDTCYGKR